jgi:DNA-binding MarR family transcriptional regulator
MPLTALQTRTLLQSPLFEGCNLERYTSFLQSLEPYIVPQGETFSFSAFSEPTLVVLLSGEVECRTKNNALFMTRRAPHTFSLPNSFSDNTLPNYFPALQAHKTIAVLTFLSASDLLPLIRTDSTLALNLIRLQSVSLYHLTDIACRFSASSPSARLAMLLLQESSDDYADISLGITNLARTLDVSRATLYRSLTELESQGLIERVGKTIQIIEREKLLRYLEK